MRAVWWEKHAQIQVDLPHRVIGLPPVSQCICFNGLLLPWRSKNYMRFRGITFCLLLLMTTWVSFILASLVSFNEHRWGVTLEGS